MPIPDVIERRRKRTIRNRRRRRKLARRRASRRSSATLRSSRRRNVPAKRFATKKRKTRSGGPAREGSKALARNKRRKRRAKKSLAKSTKRRQQRHNATRRALKSKKKKKSTSSSGGGSSSSGHSVAKRRKARLTKAQARRSKAKAARIKRRLSSPPRKKKKKKGIGPRRKYPTGIKPGVKKGLRKEAALVAKEQYLPALQEISRQMRSVRRERDRNVGVQTAFGEKADVRLADAAKWMDQVLSRQAGVTQDIYAKAGQNVETAYAGARGAQEEAGRATLAGMQGSAEQLGLQEAMTDPESQLKAQILASQAEVEGDYAEGRANLETLGAEESARAQGTVGLAARQSAQDRSDLQTQVAGGIAGIQRQAGEQLAEGQYAKRDIQQQRGLAQRNIYTGLRRERQDFQRQRFMDLLYQDVQRNTMRLQNAQLGLERQAQKANTRIARGQLNLARRAQKQGGKLARKEFRFKKNVALRQLRNERAAIEAEIAAANSPAARMQLRLELEKTQADINYVNARTAAQLAKASKFRSKRGKRNKKLWRSPLPGPGERPGGR